MRPIQESALRIGHSCLRRVHEPSYRRNEVSNAKTLYCSFCGKTQHEVVKLIAGPGDICICDECTTLAYDIVKLGPPGDREYDSWIHTTSNSANG